jgi:predicted RNase H-like HicB family nuclease
MVHLFEPFGCIANGPTTQEAIAATPEAIQAYLRFRRATGEDAPAPDSITTLVVEHVTEGQWLGNGSPYLSFGPDLEPVTAEEIPIFCRRLTALREVIAAWAERQSDAVFDAPAQGRTARAILLHVLGPTAAYLSAVTGTVPGISRLQTQAERGQVPIGEALRRATALAVERVLATTDEERSIVIQRPKEIRTLRKALRRMLEHDWEHLRELSRRPGGPTW